MTPIQELWVFLVLGVPFLFWVIPLIMIFVGAFQMKKKPARSKQMIIIAGIWLLVGVGFCGLIIM